MLGGRCHGRRGWVGASSSCPAPARDGRQLLYLLRKDKQRPGALRGRVLPRSCRKGLVSSRATTAPCCVSPRGARSRVGTQSVGFSLQREAGKGTEAWSSLRSTRAKCGCIRGGLRGGQVALEGTELLSPCATNIQLSRKLEAFPGCSVTALAHPGHRGAVEICSMPPPCLSLPTSTRASGPGSAPGWMLHIQVHVCV